MMGVTPVYTPGKLPTKFRMIPLNSLMKGSYTGKNLQQSQEALAPTTIRSGLC